MEKYYQSLNGLYLPEKYLTRHRRPIGIDLFSGAGGFSLGFIKAGFDVIAALEWDPACIQTYLVNLGAYPVQMVFIELSDRQRMERYLQGQWKKTMKKQPAFDFAEVLECGGFISGSNRHRVAPEFDGVKYMFMGDARKISGEQILNTIGMLPGEVDCIFGGPPCQGFSAANSRRTVTDPRNSLVLEFAKFIVDMKPKTCCMENVPGILQMTTPEGIPVMDAFCKILSDGNYGDYEALRKVLSSTAGCGAMIKGASKKAAMRERGPGRKRRFLKTR